MAQSIFNLYSAQAFSEQPLVLWNLDDDFSFISLIGASANWNISGGSAVVLDQFPTEKPQETVGISETTLEVESFESEENIIKLQAQPFYEEDVDDEKPTVCIHSFIYSYDANIESIEIGFETEDGNYSKTYPGLEPYSWKRLSHTVEVPRVIDDQDEETEQDFGMYPYIKVTFNGSNKYFSLYKFSVGQWSEPYNHESTGSVTVPLVSVPELQDAITSLESVLLFPKENIDVFEADPYGFTNFDKGYYLIEDKRMLATNTKLPMVFGSGDITEIYKSNYKLPSMIFPGKGFMNETGTYQNLTAEFWMKIHPTSRLKTKIFGPLSDENGVYVNRDSITLKIGPYEKSYFVGKWYRPMLINIRYTPEYVSLLINGDKVIEQDIKTIDLEFQSNVAFNKDWIGFFSDETISKFEIDCFAIYPYVMPEQSAKKKFVYGQAVGPSDEVTKKFGGTSFPVDFAYANYTKNMVYPDMTKWYAGFSSNMEADAKFLSLPKYDLPVFAYVGDDLSGFAARRQKRTWQSLIDEKVWDLWKFSSWLRVARTRELELLHDNYFLQLNIEENFFLKLRPSNAYDDIYTAITFDNINPIVDEVESIVGIFSINTSEVANATDSEIVVMHFANQSTGDTLQVIINVDQEKLQYVFNETILREQDFVVSSEKIFLAGIKLSDFKNSFAAIIKTFFNSPQNVKLSIGGIGRNIFPGKIYRVTFNNSFFTRKDTGFCFNSEGTVRCSNPAAINQYFDYIGNYTLLFEKANNSMIMDVGSAGYWEDSVPFSSFGKYIETNDESRRVYDLDLLQFNIDAPSPIYLDSNFDDNSFVSAYVSIQRFEDVGGIPYLSYTNTKGLEENKYIDFDNFTGNIDNTKFKIVDGTVIFPPKRIIDFNKAYLTIHLEVVSPGTQTVSEKIQRMSLSSIAFDEMNFFKIGTSTGNKIYPFTRQGPTYSNKIKNPFVTYKQTTPYLYLTADSGVQSLNYESDFILNSSSRGLSFPVNEQKKANYPVYGFHAWMMWNQSDEITSRKKVMSFIYGNTSYSVFLEPEFGGKRGKLVPYKKSFLKDLPTEEVSLFQNGIEQDPYVYPLSWSLFTMQFNNPVILNESLAQLELYQGFVFNNVTYFENPIEKRVDDIFEAHLGLSSIVSNDSSTLLLNSDTLNVFSDIIWTDFGGKPI
jgi:hypothetical protein